MNDRRTTYVPLASDSIERKIAAAFRCGVELRPDDIRARWIANETGHAAAWVVEAYGAGLTERLKRWRETQ